MKKVFLALVATSVLSANGFAASAPKAIAVPPSSPTKAAVKPAKKDSNGSFGAYDREIVASKPKVKTTYGSIFRIVPNFGVAAMSMTNDGSGGIDRKFDYDAGASAGVMGEFGRRSITGGVGVNFLQAGAKIGRTRGYNQDGKWVLNYVQLPLIGKYNFMGNPNNTVFAKIGVAPSFLVTRRFEGNSDGRNVSVDLQGMNDFDVMASVGAGGAIEVTTEGAIVLSVDYVRGLISAKSVGAEENNHGFVGTIGYAFGI